MKTLVFIDLPRGKTLGAAHALGYRTIAVLDRLGSLIGSVCEDRDELDELLEVERLTLPVVVSALQGLLVHGCQISRVLTHCEVYVPLANQLASVLGLPPVTHHPQHFRDKALMKTLLTEAGVPVAEFCAAHDLKEAEIEATWMSYPVVLKPAWGTASRGVVRVNNEQELRRHFRQVKLISLSMGDDRVLLENYLPGEEIAVEALTHRNQTQVILVSDKPEALCGPYFEESIYIAPSSQPQSILERVEALTCRAIAALGLLAGPSHLEFRIHRGMCSLLEVAARVGSPLPYISAALGKSYELLCLQSYDDSVELAVPATRRQVGYLLLPASSQTGLLQEVRGSEQAASIPGVWSVRLWKQPGDLVVAPPDFNGYIGTVYASGEGAAELQETLVRARAAISLTVLQKES